MVVGKVSAHSETPSLAGRGAPESPRGMQQQVLRRQNRENPPQRSFLTSTSYLRNSLQTCPATEVCVLRLRLRRLDPREKTGVDCCEDALRGLVQHRQGSPGKRNWACQRGKRSLLQGPSNSMSSQIEISHLFKCIGGMSCGCGLRPQR